MIYVYEPSNLLDANEAMIYSPSGVIDMWESLQWLSYYQETGEALLICPYTEENIAVLKVGNLLRYENEEAMLIQQVEMQDKENQATVTVRAVSYSCVLGQRIGKNKTTMKTVKEMVDFLQANHRSNGIARKICVAEELSAMTCFLESSWEDLLTVLQKICVQIGIGFKSAIEMQNESISSKLIIYSGNDLSKESNYMGYLGDVDDIENLHIISGDKDYKNVAYILGKEKDGVRPVASVVPRSISASDRREITVDASNISYKYKANVLSSELDLKGYPMYIEVEKEYTKDEYIEVLETRGAEELAKCLRKLEISAEIVQGNAILQYGEEYTLGDIILLQISEYGLRAKARVMGTKLVEEVNGGRYRTIILADFEVIE